MRYSKGYGVSGWGILAAAVLTGCGGSVDLSNEAKGGSSGSTGVGSSGSGGDSFHTGGGANPGVGGSGAGGATVDPTRVTPGPVIDAIAPRVVDDGVVLGAGGPTDGVYAFDANRDGAGRALYLSSLDTPDCALRLTSPAVQAKQPAFSPDHTHLAYAAWSEGSYQIHVLNLKSGVVEQVTDLPQGATAPSYSPDGKRLAFLTGDADSNSGPPVEGLFDVMVLDLAEHKQRVVLSSFEQGCCVPNVRAPTFFNDAEVALSTGIELIAINVETFKVRQVMPLSGRIPNPQDPSPGPDGIRYAYVDRCQGLPAVFIGRVDGSSGDSCVGATRVPVDFEAIGTDWGPHGYIAAARKEGDHGLVLIDDQSYEIVEPTNAKGGSNPAWAPAQLSLALSCQ
jgi:hypothetical protein